MAVFNNTPWRQEQWLHS